MNRIADWLFREDETLSPRLLVTAGLFAYMALIFWPVMTTGLLVIVIPLVVLSLALICYAVLRRLLPLMDPRDPDADGFVVWGGAALFLLIGAQGFGVWFAPGLVAGAFLIWWRTPELLEVFPWLEDRADTAAAERNRDILNRRR